MAEKVGELYYEVAMETRKLLDEAKRVEARLERLAAEGDKVSMSFSKIAAAVSAAIGAIAIDGLISKVVNTQRSFDVMYASLKTMTGGAQQASEAFERLRKFAAQTPFTLEQSVQGFTKLKALGLDPSERAMESFGNTASAMGKDLSQMIEAVADASTGEFERLKEFGIKAKQEGDKVSLTFQGVTTTIGNNAAEITEYLTKIGELNFGGAMSERMKTLDGDISNLQDSLSALYLQVSQSGAGDLIAQSVRGATEAIQEMTASLKQGELTEYFDGLRPYLVAAEVAVVSLAGAITSRLILAMIEAGARAYTTAAGIGVATVAARGFAAVMAALGGPVGIAITALGLLALNWDKVSSASKSAADISEDASRRIKAAIGGTVDAPMRKLMDIRDEADAAIKEIDAKLKKASDNDEKFGGQRRWGAGLKYIEDLNAAREAQRGVFLEAQKGIDDLKKRQMDAVEDSPTKPAEGNPSGGPGKKARTTGRKFDANSYLSDLKRATQEGYARIDAIEQESLRKAAENYSARGLSAAEYEKAKTLISQAAIQDRHKLMMSEAEQAIAIGKRSHDEMLALQRQVEAEKNRGRANAQTAIAAVDPVAQAELELRRNLELNAQYAALDQENSALYAQAKVALEEQTAAKIREIRARQAADEQQRQSMQLQTYSSLFGNMADLTKTFSGKQSGIYKAMFAASKAFAIADSIIKIQQGIAGAAALPFPANIPAIGTVIAATSGIISTISGTQYGGGRQYGGPVSAGSLYRVNETGRPEMFTAANGSQYMMPTKSGSVTPADKVGAGGAPQITVVIQNTGTPQTIVSQTYDPAEQAYKLVMADLTQQVTGNNGPFFNALRGATNVRGVL